MQAKLDWRALVALMVPASGPADAAPATPVHEADRVGALVGLIEGRTGWQSAVRHLGGSFHALVAGRIAREGEGRNEQSSPGP